MPSSESGKLSVITRSATNNELRYPLRIFAFDENGQFKSEKVVNSSDESVKMNLAEGKYRLVAIAGSDGYDMPADIALSSYITARKGNFSNTELAIGRADVVVSGVSSATIQMSLQVACVDINLEGLAEDVSAVSVNISKQSRSVSFDGAFGTGENTTIECRCENGVWKTGKVYVFPSATSPTVVSISTTDDSGVHSYGYTYSTGLKAGQPYQLNGTFSSGVMVDGTIEYSGWKNETVIDFSFGPGINETGGETSGGSSSDNQTSAEISVSSIPKAGTVLNGHVVASVSNATATSADVMLLSLAEWNKVSSAVSETNPTEASSIASEYSEYGMSGWRVPTKEEATTLKSLYGGENLYIINNVFESAGGTVVTATEENGGNARYLCDSSKYTFTFNGSSSSITQAGATVKYRLRLVKTVRVVVK